MSKCKKPQTYSPNDPRIRALILRELNELRRKREELAKERAEHPQKFARAMAEIEESLMRMRLERARQRSLFMGPELPQIEPPTKPRQRSSTRTRRAEQLELKFVEERVGPAERRVRPKPSSR